MILVGYTGEVGNAFHRLKSERPFVSPLACKIRAFLLNLGEEKPCSSLFSCCEVVYRLEKDRTGQYRE